MPYVVGTYRDKIGAFDSMLSSEPETVTECRASIRWQADAGKTGTRCNTHSGGDDMRTAWHIADPATEPFVMVCRDCGAELHIRRGAFTWDAFHGMARRIWGASIPLTPAELRLMLGEGF